MRNLIVALFILVLVSCGHQQTGHVVYNSDKVNKGGPTDIEFENYIVDFEIRTGADVSHVPVQFGDLDNDRVGVCYSWASGARKIVIDRNQWYNRITELQREALMWHELGHCGLNFGHNDTVRPDRCPVHIMNWQLISHFCYNKNYDDYIRRFLEDM